MYKNKKRKKRFYIYAINKKDAIVLLLAISTHADKFLGGVAVLPLLRKQMRPVVTDRVAWSVGLSVTVSQS